MASLKKKDKTYYLQYYVANQQRRVNLKTDSYRLTRFEQSSQDNLSAASCPDRRLPGPRRKRTMV